MAQPFIGEIVQLAFNWAPEDHALCDGNLLPIDQNAALYSLIGITFGGDGVNTVGLPDLRGRSPVHPGGYGIAQQGQFAGQETVVLTSAYTGHSHPLCGKDLDGDSGLPFDFSTKEGHALANAGPNLAGNTYPVYGPATELTQIGNGSISPAGATQAHNNLQPSIVINLVIALEGLYPSRN